MIYNNTGSTGRDVHSFASGFKETVYGNSGQMMLICPKQGGDKLKFKK